MAAIEGFGVLFEPIEDVGEGAHEPREAGGTLEPRQLVDVGAGAEGSSFTGDHERAHCIVGLEVDERVGERGERVAADGVQTIGSAQRDDRDGAVLVLHPQNVAHDIVSPPLTERVWPVM